MDAREHDRVYPSTTCSECRAPWHGSWTIGCPLCGGRLVLDPPQPFPPIDRRALCADTYGIKLEADGIPAGAIPVWRGNLNPGGLRR